MNIYQPFTYLIGWSKLNRWYYGVRTAVNCQPSDLWTIYFTSSEAVKLLRLQYGDPDVIQIRKIFNTAEKARYWEQKTLKRLRVLSEDKWLNNAIPGIAYGYPKGKPQTKESNRKRSNTLRGRIRSETHCQNLRKKRIKPRPPVSEETRLKLSRAARGKKFTPEEISKWKKPEKRICIHCEKSFYPPNYIKYHGDKCRFNPDVDEEMLLKRKEYAKKAASAPRPGSRRSSRP